MYLTLASLSCGADAHQRSLTRTEEKKIASTSEQHGYELQILDAVVDRCMDCMMVHVLGRIAGVRKMHVKTARSTESETALMWHEMVLQCCL